MNRILFDIQWISYVVDQAGSSLLTYFGLLKLYLLAWLFCHLLNLSSLNPDQIGPNMNSNFIFSSPICLFLAEGSWVQTGSDPGNLKTKNKKELFIWPLFDFVCLPLHRSMIFSPGVHLVVFYQLFTPTHSQQRLYGMYCSANLIPKPPSVDDTLNLALTYFSLL